MVALGSFSARGFNVTASNAMDLIAGTQAAGAGMVSANVREMAGTLHVDLANVGRTIATQGRQLASINSNGFQALQKSLAGGFGTLQAISGVSLAVQAVGFAAVVMQLQSVRKDLRELTGKAAELVELQRSTNSHLESLVDFATRQLKTQDEILATLVSSRTVEAQQLIRQGWENLHNGYEDDAFDRFKRSLEYDNTVYVTHAELGAIYEKRGEIEKAEDHLRRASRFAGRAGAEVAAFALVQFGAFMDRCGQTGEAITAVRAGIAASHRTAWLFYLAELEAVSGHDDDAMGNLRSAIAEDATFYSAAMMSDRLQALQPSLTRTLVELDTAARAPVFAALQRTCVALKQLEVLDKNVDILRQKAAPFLEASCLVAFAELGAFRDRMEKMASGCEAHVDSSAHAAGTSIRGAVEEYTRLIVYRPSTNIPAPWWSGFHIFLFTLTGFGSLIALLNQSSVCLIITLVVFGFPGVLTYFNSKSLNEEPTGRKAADPQLAVWESRVEQLEMEIQKQRDEIRERLQAAFKHGPRPVFHEGLRYLQNLHLPESPLAAIRNSGHRGQPSAMDDTISCPHCKGIIKSAAKICKHCRREVGTANI